MITVTVCAFIVGGIWWYSQNQIKKLREEQADHNELTETAVRNLVFVNEDLAKRINLLAKEIMELQKKSKKKK